MTASTGKDLAALHHSQCLLCGSSNPRGWGLVFQEDVHYTYSILRPEKHFNGYTGVLHGGVVAAVLDETMVQCLLRQGILAVTADLQVRYECPTPVEVPLRIQARMLGSRHGVYRMEAQLLESGKVCAWAKARFFKEGSLAACL